MKTAWDSYLDQQLTDATVRQTFKEGAKVLGLGLQFANQRKKRSFA